MTTIAPRAINVTAPAATTDTTKKPEVKKPVAANTAAPSTAPEPLKVNVNGFFGEGAYIAPQGVMDAFGFATKLGTMPVIGRIISASVRGAMSWSNVLQSGGAEAFRNIRAVAAHKESAARAGGNVVTATAVSIGKGIIAGAAVQCISVAAAPFLGLIPAAYLTFASIGISLGGMMLSYKLLDIAVKKTGIAQTMADKLTNIFGGDLKKA